MCWGQNADTHAPKQHRSAPVFYLLSHLTRSLSLIAKNGWKTLIFKLIRCPKTSNTFSQFLDESYILTRKLFSIVWPLGSWICLKGDVSCQDKTSRIFVRIVHQSLCNDVCPIDAIDSKRYETRQHKTRQDDKNDEMRSWSTQIIQT